MGRACRHLHHPHRIRRLLDLGRLHRTGLLRRTGAPPQPDLPLRLALPHRQLRRGQPPLRRLDRGVAHHAGPADPDLSPRLPAHLLLLPQGVLPLVLVLAAGLRRGRRPRQLQRRDRDPADPAERAPLLLLDPAPLQRHPHLRRRRGLPPTGLGIGISVGTVFLVPQRHVPLALQPQLPCLPPLLRGAGEVVRQAPRSATSCGSW